MGQRALKASWLRQSTEVENVQGVHIPPLLVESIIRFLSCLKMLKIKWCCLVRNGVQWKINYAALDLILVYLHIPFLCKSGLLSYKREMWGVYKINMFWSLMQSNSWWLNRENSCSVKPLAVCEENSIAPHCDMKVSGPGTYPERAATASSWWHEIHGNSKSLIISWCRTPELLWLYSKVNLISVKIRPFAFTTFIRCQYLMNSSKNPCWTSGNKRWEETNIGRIHLSI